MQVQSFFLSVIFIHKSSIKNCNTKPRLQLILDFLQNVYPKIKPYFTDLQSLQHFKAKKKGINET